MHQSPPAFSTYWPRPYQHTYPPEPMHTYQANDIHSNGSMVPMGQHPYHVRMLSQAPGSNHPMLWPENNADMIVLMRQEGGMSMGSQDISGMQSAVDRIGGEDSFAVGDPRNWTNRVYQQDSWPMPYLLESAQQGHVSQSYLSHDQQDHLLQGHVPPYG